MNKKLLLSLGLVVVAAAAAVGGTIAFFSDTETSVDNTFTAGAIDLRVDSQCTYNGQQSPQCGTWELKDLGFATDKVDALVPTVASEKFFNFNDVKPGDYGENTISLHVRNNDAHACLIVENMKNDDLGLTEPEREDGDTTDGEGNGELAQTINVFAWDDDGDNIWETDERILFSNSYGPASDVLNGKSYYLGTVPGGEWEDSTKTQYLGVYWCYGAITADESTHTLSCSGKDLDNQTQTDQVTADIKFYVEQLRHNEQGFTCPTPKTKAFVLTDASEQNAINKNSDKPWYEYAINGLCIDFTLHNPTTHSSWFDFQIDGDPGVVDEVSSVVIHEGPLNGQLVGNLYDYTKVLAGQTLAETKCGTDEIRTGIHFGPEQLWYLDWATFEAQ